MRILLDVHQPPRANIHGKELTPFRMASRDIVDTVSQKQTPELTSFRKVSKPPTRDSRLLTCQRIESRNGRWKWFAREFTVR